MGRICLCLSALKHFSYFCLFYFFDFVVFCWVTHNLSPFSSTSSIGVDDINTLRYCQYHAILISWKHHNTKHGQHSTTHTKRRHMLRLTQLPLQLKTHRPRRIHRSSKKRKRHTRPNRRKSPTRPKFHPPMPCKTSKLRTSIQAIQNSQRRRILPHIQHRRNLQNPGTR